MKQLLLRIDELALQVSNASIQNHSISMGSIGWHIEHSCLVIIKITETIQQSNPAAFTSKFSFKKWIVFTLGKFPRGKSKAPASVLPSDNLTEQHLADSIHKAKESIQILMRCEKNQFFKHPLFGHLNVAQTIPFLGLHTKHHLNIIQDILKA